MSDQTKLKLIKYARGIIQLDNLSVAEFIELNMMYDYLSKDVPREERPIFDSRDFKNYVGRELDSMNNSVTN